MCLAICRSSFRTGTITVTDGIAWTVDLPVLVSAG